MPTVTILEVTVVPFTVKVAKALNVTGAGVGDSVPMVNGMPCIVSVLWVQPDSIVVVPCTSKVQVTDELMSFPLWSFANK